MAREDWSSDGILKVRPWRFNELHRSLEGVSQKVLTDSLRSMEEDGIIDSHVHVTMAAAFEYAELGVSIIGEGKQKILDFMSAHIQNNPGRKCYRFMLDKELCKNNITHLRHYHRPFCGLIM